ncbi:MAPEG family protein [Oxynema aestuarii]|jgi:glutathione S-transferase|uniref:MAPEG family protein n=1 Tax=Oxynema aestuarii AP17 TaxID=2064643 RepID=A0A6H1TUG8_9CYAN|nr:MAPEG family protein [Oxynema aestuarii]QIZ69403.1 MAPEG family protein [Oxynema aestuarii AP17]RMH77674.1 MAG: MAPEG family protein [Cyanobacteria bacterium J007]
MSAWPSLVTIASLILYLSVIINVGRARVKYKIPAPQTSGDPDFERVFRVQQNTLEQLVLFLPALWLFCEFINPIWGSGLGSLWIVGRIVYAWGYYKAPEKRSIGFAIGSLTSLILILGALIGVVIRLLATGAIE